MPAQSGCSDYAEPTRWVTSALYVLLSFAHIDCRSIYIIYTSAVVYTQCSTSTLGIDSSSFWRRFGGLGDLKAQAPGFSECDGMYTMLGDDES